MTARPAGPAAVAATAAAFLVTMMGTTLPTPLYAIYAGRLDFTDLTVTVLFAVYALGVVATLTLFGRLSDDLGRRPVLMIALGLALLSAVLFLLPPSLPLLIVARVISGLSAGLMSGAGTAAVIDLFAPERRAVAGRLAVAANTGGLGLGTLFSGVVADLVAAPLFVPYAVYAGLTLAAFAGLWAFAPAAPASGAATRSVRAHRLRVPAGVRAAFVRAVLAAGTGFAVTGVLTAVSALFLAESLRLRAHSLAGGVVALAFAGMAAGQLLARRMRPRAALLAGCAGLVLAAGCLALALAATRLTPLLLAAAVLGVSGGLCLNAGIATTVERVPPAHRGEVSSSFFAGLYGMLAVPAVGVGVLAEHTGLRTAGLVFTAVVAVLAAAIWLLERGRPADG
ncbi:MFS transporter [Dactylosporangium sp. CA-092794]|uniref:MFS transporter n=1 Tax=Dactylosporangium sp. CA-092794 TaxID=3239929 RepID=UPI003D8B66BB